MNDSAPLAMARLLIIYTKRAALLHLTCAGFGRNAPLSVASFVRATDNGALPFIYLKFYVSHSYF
jgi:hypothetical protein